MRAKHGAMGRMGQLFPPKCKTTASFSFIRICFKRGGWSFGNNWSYLKIHERSQSTKINGLPRNRAIANTIIFIDHVKSDEN